jgi:acetyl esterase/lipase
VQYGSAPRNRLDLYLPSGCEFDEEKTEAAVRAADAEADAHPAAPNGHAGRDPATERLLHGTNGAGAAGQSGQSGQSNANGGRPVIVFVTGGMWIIGYKAWGALLARSLMKQGFIVASLDYRNFPQGTVGEMIQDVGCGIGWVVKRAVALGGDPNRVVVVGQSAGAHLSATAILRQAEWELSGYGLASAWSPSSLAGFVGVSGVYNPDDQGLVNHFHRRGLHKEVFHSIMEAG